MSAIRPIVASLLATALCLAPITASAAVTRAPAPRYIDQAQAYQNDVEQRMQSSYWRISAELQRRNLRPGYQQQILSEVAWSMQTIRQRVSGYAADHVITREEAADVQGLSNAIAGEMYSHYGNLAWWNLL